MGHFLLVIGHSLLKSQNFVMRVRRFNHPCLSPVRP